ncbi:class A beta-lactamase [Streptomyces albus subsp. chlorinus]|uniref:class A beta-lactamase n=1 Tax=Streptomyces albus TaxID=1888 RepID=UPI00156F5CF3|nr:class A beta-lactamase [Streptomyces albus]NSC23836.1 class A beta-lactamase [Streptomyces albus subsp. chlorinus]
MRTTTARRAVLGALGLALVVPLTAAGQEALASSSRPAAPNPSAAHGHSATHALSASSAVSSAATRAKVAGRLAELERKFDARLGVQAVDTGTGRRVGYHADERFAYASTHKAFTAAAVLDKYTLDGLDKKEITVKESDPVGHSPVTEAHVGEKLTLRELCEAAVRQSDNGADNILLRDLGGPAELDAFLEGLGDHVTQVSRYEPDLNEATPGDPRDTTTPRAFTKDLRSVLLGKGLGKRERKQLDAWMLNSPTGTKLIRAGVPEDWSVSDKSGAGRHASRNDIAVVRPPGKAPIVVSVMSKRDAYDAPYDDRLVSEAATVVADTLG